MAVSAVTITPEHARQFRDEGFFVLERVVPAGDLETLRGECQRCIDDRDREMDRLGVDELDLDHSGRRHFMHAYGQSAVIRAFLRSDLMTKVARAALGETVHLFNEQYVVKAAELGMKFGWHQDSGFIRYAHRALPHVLDHPRRRLRGQRDGLLAAVCARRYPPCRRARSRRVDHDLSGYFGDDPGDPVSAPAGSIACFSSTLFHRSGPNTTDRMRRVYVAQYAAEPILNEERSAPRHLADPLLIDGERVA